MASTPKSDDVVSLNDSWIDINENTYSPSDTPFHLSVKNNNSKNNTGPTTLQSLEKLLLDAQKESQTGHSSLKGSFLGSLPITPDGLQTPPNSIYFNNNEHVERNPLSTDWIWDWSNRDPLSKEWSNIQTNRNSRPTFRQWIIRRGILSKEVLSLLFLTNVLSLILGAGIGYTIIIRKTF